MTRPDTTPTFPGLTASASEFSEAATLEKVGIRFAQGLAQIFGKFGLPIPEIEPQAVEVESFETYRQRSRDAFGACRLAMSPLRAGVAAVLPARLVARMVDGFYGGNGTFVSDRSHFSGAEIRILERAGDLLAEAVTTAWAHTSAGPARLSATITDSDTPMFNDRETVAIQRYVLSNSPYDGCSIDLLYPIAGLRSLSAQAVAEEPAKPDDDDGDWQDRLIDAILQVRLPLRTIFARAELSLSELLDLRAGDLIPICLSETIPVTVADRRFATATIGESNGRASILIHAMQKENEDDL